MAVDIETRIFDILFVVRCLGRSGLLHQGTGGLDLGGIGSPPSRRRIRYAVLLLCGVRLIPLVGFFDNS